MTNKFDKVRAYWISFIMFDRKSIESGLAETICYDARCLIKFLL